MVRTKMTWQSVALSLLRFVSGLLFLEHGTAKLLGFPAVAAFATGHLPPVEVVAGTIELVGGALLVIGLLTRPAAFIMSGEMAIGYFAAHFPKSPFPVLNGGGLAILFCFVFLYIAVAGGGPIGLDRLIGSRFAARA